MSGRFVFDHLDGVGAHRLAERIVLVDQVQLLDVRVRLHVAGERFHLDVGVRVPAEVPVVALVVGEHRIDRGVVEVDDFLAGIALVVLGDELRNRPGHRRAVALGDDANARVDRLLHLHERFLRVELVVEGNELDLLAEHTALGVLQVGDELERLETDLADAGAAARKRIDVGDLGRVLRRGRGAQAQHRTNRKAVLECRFQRNPPLVFQPLRARRSRRPVRGLFWPSFLVC